MPNYGGLGLVNGIGNGLNDLRSKMIQDKQVADEQAAADRAAALFPGQLESQKAQLGLVKTQQTAAQQAVDLNKQTAADKVSASHDSAKEAHNNAIASGLNLDAAQWQRLHTGIYVSAKLLNDQVANTIRTGGTQGIDPSIVENAYNEQAPKGQRIKPGSLQIIPDATNPGATQIRYVRDDGKTRTTTLADWNQVAAAYIPPAKNVVVGKDQRLVNSTNGQVVTDTSTGGDVSSVSPNGWASQVSTQIAKNYGGLIDAQGNLTGLNNDTARTVGDLAGAAAAYGKSINYAVPAPTVAAAAKYVHDSMGIDPKDPKFMGALDQTVKQYSGGSQSGAGGIPASAPSATTFGLPNPLTQQAPAANPNAAALLQQAKAAIGAGKDPQAVRQRLQQLGVSDADIQAAGI